MAEPLTIPALLTEAALFSEQESTHSEPVLYGVTDGKAVGTYIEQKFRTHLLQAPYVFRQGNSASGIDFPDLLTDVKATSVRQPQSSSPFKSARQKIYGLGYNLLVFVYEKTDDARVHAGRLNIIHAIFVDEGRTADYQTTRGIRLILERDGNHDDLLAFLLERNLPVDDILARELADEILRNPPPQGYLTISNALQWRLQYSRAIGQAGSVEGIHKVR